MKKHNLVCLLFVLLCSSSQISLAQAPRMEGSAADTLLARKYFDLGREFTSSSQFDSANHYFEKAGTLFLRSAARGGQPKFWEDYVRCYNNIGNNLRSNGEYEAAAQSLNKALRAAADKLGEHHVLVATCHHNLGNACYSMGDYDQALEHHSKALAIRTQLFGEKHAEVASSMHNLGAIHYEKGNYDQALAFYTKALAARQQAFGENHPRVASSYNNIGLVHFSKGDFENALAYYDKALRIKLQVFGTNSLEAVDTYNNIGIVHQEKGDYDQALAYYSKFLAALLRAHGDDHPEVAEGYNNVGIIYQDKGDHDNAIKVHTKALEIRVKTPGINPRDVAYSYHNLGVAVAAKGDFERAVAYHTEAIATYARVVDEHHPELGIFHNKLGEAYAGKGEFVQAAAACTKALAIARRAFGEKHPDAAEALLNLGDFHLAQNDNERALSHYQNAIIALARDFEDSSAYANPDLRGISSEVLLLRALDAKAGVLRQRSHAKSHDRRDLETAYATHLLAAKLIDNMRLGYKAEGSKLLLAAKAGEACGHAIRTALELAALAHDDKYKEQAFVFAEKAKAAVLSEALQESRARQFSGIPGTLLQKEKSLRIELAFLETHLQKESEKKSDRDDAKIAEFENRHFDVSDEYQRLVESLERHYPAYHDLKYQASPADLAALQKALPPGSTLLEYFVGDSTICIFAISQEVFTVKAVARDSSFDRLVGDFLRAIKKIKRGEYLKTSRKLHELLIEPIQPTIAGAEKLIVIPDGLLCHVPFEALVGSLPAGNAGEKSSVDFSKLDYLVRRYEIGYHYSAALYQKTLAGEAAGAAPVRQESFIGFAPVFSDSVKNGEVLASSAAADTLSSFSANPRSSMIGGRRFSELKYSEEEVKAIVALFEKHGKAGGGYFHRQATEENFKRTAGGHKYVHIATHGILDEGNPKLSGLVFSQPVDSTSADDGILYAGETFDLGLDADLIVLSSCESGLGKLVKGEGLMALTRGFIYAGTAALSLASGSGGAGEGTLDGSLVNTDSTSRSSQEKESGRSRGAPSLIVSLWKVFDKHTGELMVELYKNILGGKSYAGALRAAKLRMIRNSVTAFPQSWSAFVLVGK